MKVKFVNNTPIEEDWNIMQIIIYNIDRENIS